MAASAPLVDAAAAAPPVPLGPGIVEHTELRWPGGGVMLGSHPSCDIDLTPDTGSIYIVTTEPDALFEPAIAAGASVVRGLRDEDYGSRGFTVRDPRRVFWSFGTYAGS